MTESSPTPAESQRLNSSNPESDQEDAGDGPGWLPAIMAATALMGIVGFIVCAFSTWFLFQKRTEFAIRTLRGAYIGEIEQSLLDPDTKSAVVAEIKSLAADLERRKYEDSQAAEIMQGLLRLPVLQWGELQAVEAFVRQSTSEQRDENLKQLSRLRRAVELGTITAMDVDEALAPVRIEDSQAISGFSLVQPMTEQQVAEVALRCKLVADRESIPDQTFDDIGLDVIVRRAIERAAKM